ncbi:methyl-accepting chemotaxis protein [Niallia taxi]|uniref:methyl-accepting chemotaxis protein n=1 Tax=Niallia taxi TaxID=2499688 RepID=UPI0015F6AD47|nr:methyl-accepting chemotaxis protein [Niallia taxi]MED4057712.1 methyl-accepting chemotaxis protein [Niallia taxi]
MNYTVSKKLLTAFGLVLALLAIAAVVSFIGFKNADASYSTLIDVQTHNLDKAKDLKISVREQSAAVRGYMLTGEEDFEKDIDTANENFEEVIEYLLSHLTVPQNIDKVKNLQETYTQYNMIVQDLVKLIENGQDNEAIALMNAEGRNMGDQLSAETVEIVEAIQKKLTIENERVSSKTKSISVQVLSISIIAIMIGILLSIMISRMITRPVKKVSEAMRKLALGNLDIEPVSIKNKDELGEMGTILNGMIAEFRKVVGQVRESSEQVAASSEELAASSDQSTKVSEHIAVVTQKSAEGSEQQMIEFQKVSSSVDQMVSGLHQIARNSEDMQQVANLTASLTRDGAAAISNVEDQMGKIVRTVSGATKIIQSLENKSEEISHIVSIITGIADQTNLLALNAAIEAARAGENGKGFAVVADEVRKLAEDSKKSADQIKEMIAMILNGTVQAVGAMRDGHNQVQEGMKETRQASSAFMEISTSMGNVSDKVKEVTISVESLVNQSDQVSIAMEQLTQISMRSVTANQESSAATEEQLATMEEVSAAANSLAYLSEDLQEIIKHFKL